MKEKKKYTVGSMKSLFKLALGIGFIAGFVMCLFFKTKGLFF